MIQKIKQISILNPGGNITAIVKDKVSRKLQPLVAETILDQYNQGKSEFEKIEQVCFEEKPTNSQASARLRLAGGEFSGNATLCFAYLKTNDKKAVNLEISGVKDILKTEKVGQAIKAQMPSLRNVKQIRKISRENYPIIFLNGIVQVIVNDFYYLSEAQQKQIGLKIIKNNQLEKQPAAGILFIKNVGEKVKMKPYVYFEKGTQWDLYKETGCGSGSTAIAINQYFLKQKNIKDLKIIQPSLRCLSVSVKKTNGNLQSWLEGQVDLIYQGPFSFKSKNVILTQEEK